MKRILLIAVMLVATLCAWAGKDIEVPIVVQIIEAERGMMPDKTIEMEVKNVKFGKKADAQLTCQLTGLMDTLAQSDYDNYVYVVILEPNPTGETQVTLRSEDVLKNGGDEKTYFGTMVVARKHFLFVKTKDNERLLKSLLDKDKGKVTYVREYEIVENKTERHDAMVTARFSGNTVLIETFMAGGENILITQ